MMNVSSGGSSRIERVAGRIAFGVIVVAALLGIAWVMRTLILTLLLALVGIALVLPIHRFVEKRWGTTAGALIASHTMLLGIVGVALGVGYLFHLEQDTLRESVQAMADDLLPRAQGIPAFSDLMQPEMLQRVAAMGVGTTGALGSVLVAVFLVLLVLLDADGWRRRLDTLMGEGNVSRVRTSLDRIRTYYATRGMLCLVSGVISGVWLTVMGVPSAWVWAVLITILNFIPTIGSWIAAIPPVAVTFVTADAGTAAIVAGGLFAQEQIVGNGLDPLLQGSRLHLNPTILLLAVVGVTIVLGLAGAFFAGPLVILSVAVLDAFPQTRPLTVLLQDDSGAQTATTRHQDHPELARSTDVG